MTPETLTRLRNAIARAALEWLETPASPPAAAASELPFTSMTEGDWRQAVLLWRAHAGELLASAPPRACPACGGDRSRFLFVSYDAHPFHECDGCGCWFEPKTIETALFDRFFARSPEAGALAARMMQARDRHEGRDADMARVGAYLDDLLPLLPDAAGRAYLDTGCGVGHSLRAGRDRGLRVQGVEADATAVAIARAAGLPVAGLADPVPAGPYHILSFFETLEHVAAPLRALEQYVPLLHDDGLVAITVPNLHALATRSMREACAWVHGGYNTPGHVNLFGPGSLETLLRRAGLSVLDVDGQFSANPVELAAFLIGETGGALDLVSGAEPGALPSALVETLTAAWPGAALVERLGLVSPILFVIACRQGRESRFAARIAARQAARRQAIALQARTMIAGEPDYKAMTEALQAEVNTRDALLQAHQGEIDKRDALLQAHQGEIERRDELLRTTVAGLQQEIGRRDDLLTTTMTGMQAEINRRDVLLRDTNLAMQGEIDRRDGLLRETAASMQAEINLRDQLLAAARERFERTINGRVLAVRRKIGRMFSGGGKR